MMTTTEQKELKAARLNVKRLMLLGDISQRTGQAMLSTLNKIGYVEHVRAVPPRCRAWPNCYCCS